VNADAVRGEADHADGDQRLAEGSPRSTRYLIRLPRIGRDGDRIPSTPAGSRMLSLRSTIRVAVVRAGRRWKQ
jgi:hypothetical protein